MQNTTNEIKKGKSSRKRIIWTIVIGVVVLLLAAGGIEVYRILCTPQDLFAITTIDPAKLATPTPALTPVLDSTGTEVTPTALPTPTPGITEGKEIVNILLIGIDRREEADGADSKGTAKSAGTEPHADVQMILAVNFKENKVDLISLLRDTFVHEPALMPGVYKLNATFNVGGGFTDPSAGFQKVCEGAEYMLGGIPVDYYYAVDFEALVKMVDAIGGVDYDVENRSYSPHRKAGMQHMDGEDVLWYVRNRKKGPEVHDPARSDRQKDIMVAIFTQLKEKGQLSMVPDLINAASSGVYTNTSLEQTLALANFAMNIDPKNIGMHTMPSRRNSGGGLLGWIWYFVDQPERQKLIKQIYGLDVPEQVHCTEEYAKWLDRYGFSGMVYLKTAKQVMDYAELHKAEFTEEQQKAHDTLAAAYEDTQKAWNLASVTLLDADTRAMINSQKKLKSETTVLAELLGYKEKIKWTFNGYGNNWVFETKINEVFVDFK